MRRSFRPMTPKEFRAILTALGMDQSDVAQLLHRTRMTANRYAAGATPVPVADAVLLRALVRQEMTLDQVLDLAAAKPPH